MTEWLHEKIKPKKIFFKSFCFYTILILIFIFFVLSISGCDIFNAREAEKPTQPRADFEPAATADILIQNLINSLKDKDVGNYLNCLSDTSFTDKKFHFLPSSEAVLTYPSLMDWNRRNEEQYFTNMVIKVSSTSQVVLAFTVNSINIISPDSIIYTAAYSLNVPFINTNSEIIPEIYQGTLTFKLVRDSRSVWSIYYWQDTKTSSESKSWSDLKGSLAN
jgi:hypothetical protein